MVKFFNPFYNLDYLPTYSIYLYLPKSNQTPTPMSSNPIHGSKEAINRQLYRTKINEERYLLRAAADGSSDDVEKLLDYGANIEQRGAVGMRALHYAAKTNNVGAVIALMNRAADANAEDDNERTPLHIAVIEGHLQIVKLLLGRGGANIEASDINKQTALHHAVMSSSVEIVKELMDRKANRSAMDSHGCTPIKRAREAEKRDEILVALFSL